MAQLRQDYPELVRRGVEVVVLGPDSPEAFKQFWAENDMPFTGLADPSTKALSIFGQQINWLKLGRMPAQLVIDRAGRERYSHYGRAMSDITTSAELLRVLDEIAAAEKAGGR